MQIGDASKFKLSGGEEQRLSLIRAICRKPKYLFADEFTASLDARLEKIAYKLATKYSTNLIFISHSQNLIDNSEVKLKFPIQL